MCAKQAVPIEYTRKLSKAYVSFRDGQNLLYVLQVHTHCAYPAGLPGCCNHLIATLYC